MLLDTDEPKYRDSTEELVRSSNDRQSLSQNKTYLISPSAIGSQKSTTSGMSLKEARIMEQARLQQLKLEQQYISRKKQAEVEAELLENELQIAIAESKLDVLAKADEPQENKPAIPFDHAFVANYVSNHSITAVQSSL